MSPVFQILIQSLALLTLFVGCATPYNYEKFRAAKPRSILILPPINQSTDVRGTYSYLSTVTMPVAERGFYVFPVAVVDQMMKENGLPSANEMHQASIKKIREIMSPDAILYLTLEKYGTTYVVVDSQTTVTVSGKLISAITGEVIWEGKASATPSSSSGNSGVAGLLVAAIIKQAVSSSTDEAHKVSAQANQMLFNGKDTGLLNGPYAPNSYD
jgi:hypothetical protein